MAWIIPENKLDAQQRDFIDNVNIESENMWIKGFPGSGKSVLLVYTVKRILARNPSASIAVVVFTRSLVEMFETAFRELNVRVQVVTANSFAKTHDVYDYVLCDEVQDLSASMVRLMRNHGRHLIIAGDPNQSIYENDLVFRAEPTVRPQELPTILGGREFELNIIHRLTRSIINAVQQLVPNMNILSAKVDLTKQDTQIRLCEATSQNEEVKYVMQEARKAVEHGYSSGVLMSGIQSVLSFINTMLELEGKSMWVPTLNQWGKPDMGALNRYLASQGIPLQYVGNGYGNLNLVEKKITLMTYHSAKGLDFDNVFLPFCNAGLYLANNEGIAKTLFMVGMTRSRNNLYITYHGYASDYLNAFRGNCQVISIGGQTPPPFSTPSNPWGF